MGGENKREMSNWVVGGGSASMKNNGKMKKMTKKVVFSIQGSNTN